MVASRSLCRVRNVAIGLMALLCTLCGIPRPTAFAQIMPDSVIVAIVSNDEFYVGRDRVGRVNVATEVARRLEKRPKDEQIAYIKASRDVSYGTLVYVIDAIRETGYARIGLISDKEVDRRATGSASTLSPSTGAHPAETAPDNGPEVRPDIVVVTVHGKPSSVAVAIDGRVTTSDTMERDIRERLSDRHLASVVIVAGASLPYSAIIDVVDAAKAAGAQTIGFEIDYLQTTAPNKRVQWGGAARVNRLFAG